MCPDQHPAEHEAREEEVSDPTDVLRMAAMTQALLDETDRVTLDEAGRHRLTEIHRRAVGLVKAAVSSDLEGELNDLTLPLVDGVPTEPELRIAQAQLIGWLEGLLKGMQVAALSRVRGEQLEQMQRQLAERRPEAEDSEHREGRAYL